MITFVMTTPPLDATARHGLDMLAMAVSLDQPTQAIFLGNGVHQLTTPQQGQPDPLKKLAILLDIFDFEDFYTTEQDLAATGLDLEHLRVPVKFMSEQEAQQACEHQSRFVMRF